MSFRDALEGHLEAISARDIERFAATISRDPQARLVGPDGTAIVGYEAIVEAHRGWFAGPAAWTFAPRIVAERAGDGVAFALLEVDYREGSAARQFVLSLVFVREDERWKLFYDQNTTRA